MKAGRRIRNECSVYIYVYIYIYIYYILDLMYYLLNIMTETWAVRCSNGSHDPWGPHGPHEPHGAHVARSAPWFAGAPMGLIVSCLGQLGPMGPYAPHGLLNLCFPSPHPVVVNTTKAKPVHGPHGPTGAPMCAIGHSGPDGPSAPEGNNGHH